MKLRQSFIACLAFGIGSIAASSAFAQDNPAPDLSDDRRIDGIPETLVPWRDPDNPNIQRLDDGWNKYYLRKDMVGDNPQREPGPIDLQRYHVLPTKHAFPTYFGLPYAMTTEDLIAGEVDIALVGAPSEYNPASGNGWAANYLRINHNYDFAQTGHDLWFNNEYFEELNIVDYGNANQHPSLMMQNFANQALVFKEILDGGAMPLVLGGDHGTQVASLMALYDHYGPKSFTIVHFDAHTDLAPPDGRLGMFTHGGAALRFAHEQGLADGDQIFHVGLRGAYDSVERMDWMFNTKTNYYFMPQFEKNGFKETADALLAELEGRRIYISLDMDVIDPAHVPGVSNPEIGGFTTKEMMQLLRMIFLQNEVIMMDISEYSPLLDDRRRNTANTINRLQRHVFAAYAARKSGITDPNYVHPAMLKDNSAN
ncbi:arginase family protein [Roseibium sp.]|uniref:arginase family protein n=1 Tax=Roseibium sp. TaxID=1936156 RepID=UPI003D131D10